MRGLGYNTEYKMEYKTGEGRRLRRSNVEDGLGSLEQGLGRDWEIWGWETWAGLKRVIRTKHVTSYSALVHAHHTVE